MPIVKNDNTAPQAAAKNAPDSKMVLSALPIPIAIRDLVMVIGLRGNRRGKVQQEEVEEEEGRIGRRMREKVRM